MTALPNESNRQRLPNRLSENLPESPWKSDEQCCPLAAVEEAKKRRRRGRKKIDVWRRKYQTICEKITGRRLIPSSLANDFSLSFPRNPRVPERPSRLRISGPPFQPGLAFPVVQRRPTVSLSPEVRSSLQCNSWKSGERETKQRER